MTTLALVILVQDRTGSYSVAGAAAAAVALSGIVVVPAQGALLDRYGPRRTLLPFAVLFALFLAALITLSDSSSQLVVVLLAFAAGASFPPVFAALRTRLTTLTAPGPERESVFAIESIVQESIFVVGPLLVGALTALIDPAAPVAVCGGLTVIGSIAFVIVVPSPGREKSGSRRSPSILRSRAMQVLMAISIAEGLAFGTLDIAVPAFAEEHSDTAAAGLLLAVFGVGSVLGGIWFGARRERARISTIMLCSSGLLSVAFAALALPTEMWSLGGILLIAGLFVAPVAAGTYVLVGEVVSSEAPSSAFAWLSASVSLGLAIGSLSAGRLVQVSGTELVFVTSAGLLALVALTAFLARDAFSRPDV